MQEKPIHNNKYNGNKHNKNKNFNRHRSTQKNYKNTKITIDVNPNNMS